MCVEPDYLLYSEVSPHWTRIGNVASMPPIIFVLQGGSKGVDATFGSPPLARDQGQSPEAKIDVKLPCKML